MGAQAGSMRSRDDAPAAIHVIAGSDRWLVSRGQLPFEAYLTKSDAITAGRALARRFGAPMVVDDQSGGRDQLPPRRTPARR